MVRTHLYIRQVSSKGQVRDRARDDDNNELPEEEEEVDHTVQHHHPH